MSRGERYAEDALRETNHLDPAFMIVSGDGSFMVLPADTSDEHAKRRSVAIARLACVAHAATAVVFVSEAWMSHNPHFGARASQAPDRREILMISGETYSSRKQRLLPIIRHESGKFAGFVEGDNPNSDQVQGKFSTILPSWRPTAQEREEAKRMLADVGVKVC